ncbi:phosphoribosylamine--glycine ligase [Candidatus Peregrinibacteria bacterium]|nr:phosphoribosylamine--glycine ligase [Candidatus Peregrinibacteria bacterium]
MKRILLIGSGAREHAIAKVLKKSRHDTALYVVGSSKNPGIVDLADDYIVGDLCNHDLVREFALKVKPEFAILGPEAPVAAGIADMLLEIEIHSASPLQTVGRLESSKSFTRDLLEKYSIVGNPLFGVFYDENGLEEFFDELGDDFVVKADGLKGGKGVKVSGDHLSGRSEGLAYARECLEDCGRVVVEEKLIGQEFSLMSFCDGKHTVDMPCIQDHKRAYEGDKGPNTGGMGTYSDANHLLPFLKAEEVKKASEITRKVAEALFQETGVLFKGVMYGGFIVTAHGVRLIEYNARFGDPEAMNVLPLLKTDFVDICEAIIEGRLDELEIEFENKATVCKYIVPEGYPDQPVKNERIEIGEPGGEVGDVEIFYASVDERDDGLYLCGSRAVAFVGIGSSIEEAEKAAQRAVEGVKGPVFYRRDIGSKALIDVRVKMMEELRKKA